MNHGQREFLWQVHSYQNEYIRFADSKAAVTSAWCTALIGALYASELHKSTSASAACVTLGVIAASGLVAGFVFSVLALTPRLRFDRWSIGKAKVKPPPQTGLIYWGQVHKFAKADDYCSVMNEATDEDHVEQLALHVHVLSDIAVAKFRLVNFAIWASALGSLFLIFALLLKP